MTRYWGWSKTGNSSRMLHKNEFKATQWSQLEY
jgi:hypothetical protein